MSFVLFIAYILFTYLRPFDTIALGLAPYRPMLVLWSLAFFAGSLRAASRDELAARPAHFGLLGMLVGSIALSNFANQSTSGALSAVADFSAAAMLMVLCLLNITSLRRLKVTCAVIASCVIFLAALGVFSWHTGYLAEELVLKQSANEDAVLNLVDQAAGFIAIPAQDHTGQYFLRLRSLGFLNDPNDFAQTLVMVLPMLWWFYVPGRRFRNFWVVVAPGALVAYSIYLTQSRGALLGLAALGLFVAQRMLGWLRTMLLATLVVIAVGVLSFGGREFSVREQSAAQRVEAWQEGITMLRSKPVLGVGYGRFTEHHYLTAHNSFVLCFAELGFVGYFAWMGLIVLAFKGLSQAIRLAPQGSPERELAGVLSASLIAFLSCSWFLSRTYSPGLFVLLALCVASRFGVKNLDGLASAAVLDEPLQWRQSTLVAMVVSIAGVYAFVVLQRNTS